MLRLLAEIGIGILATPREVAQADANMTCAEGEYGLDYMGG
jgi:hypothetical protein